MKPVLSPSQMYELEAQHFKSGMPALTAMEYAASAFVAELEEFVGTLRAKNIYVACGSGNNAGDGYAAARLAVSKGASVTLIAMTPIDELSGSALTNARRAVDTYGIPCLSADALCDLTPPDVWVDALFGIGLNRPMSEKYSELLDCIEEDHAAGSIVTAIDVPSGLNAATGCIEGRAVHADLTVTFEYPKLGHYLPDGMDCCGHLVVRSIGMTKYSPSQSIMQIESSDAAAAFPPRRRNTHKGTYGHVLVVAGSMGMCGAAAYAARAALRSGAGLVSIACAASIVPILQTIVPAAMCIPLPEENGALCAAACPALRDALRDKSAVIVGPGLSRRADSEVIRTILECELPAVVDADALNIISDHPELKQLLKAHHVITPHPGEAARLLGCLHDPLADAAALHKMGASVILKGASSIICGTSPEGTADSFISTSGCAGMATGGSGDVLCGILGALLARGMNPLQAACCASHIHGLCGESAALRLTEECMTASDLIDELPNVVRALQKTSSK